jgi:multisubunit Na+/H+ antiporter MnhB subunit
MGFMDNNNPISVRTIGKIVSPIIILFSFYLLIAGHNDAGGEFPAAIMFALGFICISLTQSGVSKNMFELESTIKIIAIGLLIAISTGFIGPLLGDSMFTHYHGYFDIPLIGELHLSTQYIFAYSLTLSISFIVLLIIFDLKSDNN